jgi:hypothetical protein
VLNVDGDILEDEPEPSKKEDQQSAFKKFRHSRPSS